VLFNAETIQSGLIDVSDQLPVDISVIIPLYNEAENLQPLHKEITDVLRQVGRTYEIVFVNDGSTDGSVDILEQLAQSDPRVVLIHLRRNFGKAMALSVGFKEARGNIIITMDGDLQDNPIEIPKFIAEIESGQDLVSGWKLKRLDPLSKTLPSKLFNKVVSLVTGLRIHDFNCGFKAYSRNVLENLRIYGELHRYIPALAHGEGFRVSEIAVDHRPRAHGKSKYGWERYLRGMFDLLTVLFITRYMRKPLHFFGSLGLVFMSMGFVINAYLAVWWFMGHAIGHRPLLSLGVLLMVMGVQFISTGLVGEMITRNQQPDEGSFVARKVNSPKRGDDN